MKFRDIVRSIGTPQTVDEAIVVIKAERGRGASRYLANTFGVAMRTAQKWLSGQQKPSARAGRQRAVIMAAPARMVAANALRNAQALNVGDVDVEYPGKGKEGKRRVGTLHVDRALRRELDKAADQLEAGDDAAAQRTLSDAVLGAYSGQRAKDDRRILSGVLRATDYSRFDIV